MSTCRSWLQPVYDCGFAQTAPRLLHCTGEATLHNYLLVSLWPCPSIPTHIETASGAFRMSLAEARSTRGSAASSDRSATSARKAQMSWSQRRHRLCPFSFHLRNPESSAPPGPNPQCILDCQTKWQESGGRAVAVLVQRWGRVVGPLRPILFEAPLD